MDMVLLAGLWLDGSAWEEVLPHLRDRGHRPVPVTLPGQGARPERASLDDQRAAVLAAVDAAEAPALVVGHSAAVTLAWLAVDARPHKVARAVLIGGFPSTHGEPYADFFPAVDGAVPFPGWEPFEGPDADDLTAALRATIAARAIPVPEAVAKGAVTYADDARFDVPVTVVCPEFSPAQAKEWVESAEVPELGRARHVDYVDIDSGHWPMFTHAAELAALLDDAAAG